MFYLPQVVSFPGFAISSLTWKLLPSLSLLCLAKLRRVEGAAARFGDLGGGKNLTNFFLGVR